MTKDERSILEQHHMSWSSAHAPLTHVKRGIREGVFAQRRERERERQTNSGQWPAQLTWTSTLHQIQPRCLDSVCKILRGNISPRVSSSSSFRTLLSSESSSEDFLPSFTGTTVKLVGIFSPCEASVFLLICPSHPLPLLLSAGLFE